MLLLLKGIFLFPVASVTNYHKLGALSKTDLLSYNSIGDTSEGQTDDTGYNQGISCVLCLFLGALEPNPFPSLF